VFREMLRKGREPTVYTYSILVDMPVYFEVFDESASGGPQGSSPGSKHPPSLRCGNVLLRSVPGLKAVGRICSRQDCTLLKGMEYRCCAAGWEG